MRLWTTVCVTAHSCWNQILKSQKLQRMIIVCWRTTMVDNNLLPEPRYMFQKMLLMLLALLLSKMLQCLALSSVLLLQCADDGAHLPHLFLSSERHHLAQREQRMITGSWTTVCVTAHSCWNHILKSKIVCWWCCWSSRLVSFFWKTSFSAEESGRAKRQTQLEQRYIFQKMQPILLLQCADDGAHLLHLFLSYERHPHKQINIRSVMP